MDDSAFPKEALILILDELTGVLNTEVLLEALERLRKGRTTLIIVHRLSTIRTSKLTVPTWFSHNFGE